MTMILPPDTATNAGDSLDVGALAYALSQMHPALRVALLPGETFEDMRARRAAAADILDDCLDEYGRQVAEEVAA